MSQQNVLSVAGTGVAAAAAGAAAPWRDDGRRAGTVVIVGGEIIRHRWPALA